MYDIYFLNDKKYIYISFFTETNNIKSVINNKLKIIEFDG